LEDDLNPFYEAALQDPSFSVVVMRLFGYHPLKFLTPFEAACWAILTQRNLIPLAVKMRHSIVQAYGGGISIEDVSYRTFPEPERLAKVPENEFVDCLGDEKRAGQILKAAQAFSTIEESWLLSADFVRVENWLHNLQGIGFSSATMILIQGLGRMEQASYTDKKLLSAVAKVYGKSIAREDVPKLAAQYGKWQGYWASYLSHFSAK
jgi:DNA-3-methyladenine glycosylase II